MQPEAGALYDCEVMHRRPGPPRYRFTYRAYYLLLDIDRIDAACAASALLSRNRFNLFAFYDRDHGPHDGSALRPWVEALLAERGVALDGGRIQLLCLPRVLGYGFNPISLYYCEHADGSLRAIVTEVHNTFGEHHCYVLHADGAPMTYFKPYTKTKQFHVSPLIERHGEYHFRISPPQQRMTVGIRLLQEGALRMTAVLAGARVPLASRNLLGVFVRIPLMTFKVVAAIHWQALKIWLRGAPYVSKPQQQHSNIS